MKFKKTIGILGGMGPVASINMYKTIIKICQDKYHCQQDFDFPKIIIYNLPLYGFNETGIVDKQLVKEQLIIVAKKMELVGADFLIMACNTVHYFQKDIEKGINIYLLSMIDNTTTKVKAGKYTKVGVLSSASTSDFGLYEKSLEKFGVEMVKVNQFEQEIINNIILDVMTDQLSQKDIVNIKKIIDNLISQGAEAIILGCTELPLAISQKDVEVKLFNSTEIIAEEALKYCV